MTYVKANVDEETHKELRLKAAERGTTISEVVREILENNAGNEGE